MISGIGLQWLPNSVLEEKGKKISLILSKKFKKSFLSTDVGRNGEKKLVTICNNVLQK